MTFPKRFIDVGGSDEERANATTMCPKCRSKNIHTAAKQPSKNSYWRCLNCGEVWNPERTPDTTSQWWRRR